MTTNALSGAPGLIPAPANPALSSSPSHYAANFWRGFQSFSPGFVSLVQASDQSLTNAAFTPTPKAPIPARTNSPAGRFF